MPDSTGKLSPEDLAKIRSWWDQHWKGEIPCPVCQSTKWATVPHIVNLARHAGDANVPGSVSYPQIAVMSPDCGHTMLFNAQVMGIGKSYDPAIDKSLVAGPAGDSAAQ